MRDRCAYFPVWTFSAVSRTGFAAGAATRPPTPAFSSTIAIATVGFSAGANAMNQACVSTDLPASPVPEGTSVVVLAGMGYLPGVPWASFLLGLIQSFFLIFFNPSWTLLAVFTVLFLILLVSPTGLFRKGV